MAADLRKPRTFCTGVLILFMAENTLSTSPLEAGT